MHIDVGSVVVVSLVMKLPIELCRKREKKLEEELRRASEEKEAALAPRMRSSSGEKRGRKDSASAEAKTLSEEVPPTSIFPDTAFETIVSTTCM